MMGMEFVIAKLVAFVANVLFTAERSVDLSKMYRV